MRRRYGPHDLPEPFRRALFPTRRPGPIVACWNWRYELFALAAAVAVATTVGRWIDPLLWAGAVLGISSVVASSRRARACCRGRVRAVWVQHRLRVGFREAGLHSTRGRAPVLLWTRPHGTGEWSLVHLPAGVTRLQMIEAAPILAGATWASSVEIEPYGDRPHLVTVHVLRTEGTG